MRFIRALERVPLRLPSAAERDYLPRRGSAEAAVSAAADDAILADPALSAL